MKGPMDSMSNANKGHVTTPNRSNHSSHSSNNVDFSEYVWMGEEMEDFDRKVLADLYEQEFIEQCFEEMLEEEESEWFYPQQQQNEASELAAEMAKLSVHSQQQQQTSTEQKKQQEPAGDSCKSTLNPDAAEFVPRSFVNPEVEQAR